MNKRQKQKSDKRLMEISWSDIQKHPDIAAIKAGALLWALSNSDDLLTIVVANHNIDRLFWRTYTGTEQLIDSETGAVYKLNESLGGG